jgi:hypothetical protein
MTDERGTVTAFVTVMTVALLAVAGLVFDGGRALAARRMASNEAEAAARAGAQAVDIETLRRVGVVRLEPGEAERRALDYLALSGHAGLVRVDGDIITVHVTFEHDLSILGAVGLGPMTIEGDGEAHAVRGVQEPEP